MPREAWGGGPMPPQYRGRPPMGMDGVRGIYNKIKSLSIIAFEYKSLSWYTLNLFKG